MEDKTYLEYLSGVATDLVPTNGLGAKLRELWADVEAKAKAWEYDVLAEYHRVHSTTYGLRADCRQLIRHLYMVSGANAEADVQQILRKDKEYGGSWKTRGGVGAFMMAARKWDRLANQLEKHDWDLDAALDVDTREEGILDDVGDLRRYLLLWEAYHVSKEKAAELAAVPQPTVEDRPF